MVVEKEEEKGYEDEVAVKERRCSKRCRRRSSVSKEYQEK